MQEPTTVERALSADADTWYDENSRGLALAAEGDWSNATGAFRAAVDVVSARTDVAAHEAQALILNNLAQACFRSGRPDEAIRHAQRACSLRVALLGEDAIAVARARAELAVMLGSMHRAVEGLGLIRRAIAGIERSAGDDDVRLVSVLENAARLAMVAGQPSIAEPYLLRLHALLDAHELSTEPADMLLARLTAFRVEQQVAAMETIAGSESSVDEFAVYESAATELPVAELPVAELPVAELPVAELPVAELPVAELPVAELPVAELPVAELPVAELPVAELPVAELPVAELPVEELMVAELPVEEVTVAGLVVEEVATVVMPEILDSLDAESGRGLSATPAPTLDLIAFEEHDDQPLRDAVVLTDVLLRSTPTCSRAIPLVIERVSDDGALDSALDSALDNSPDDPKVTLDADANHAVAVGDEFTQGAASSVDNLGRVGDVKDTFERAIDDRVETNDDVEATDETEINNEIGGEIDLDVPSGADDIFGGSTFDLIDEHATPATPVNIPSAFGMDVELDLVMDESNGRDGDLPAPRESDAKDNAALLGGLGFAVEYGAVSAALELDDIEPSAPPAPRTPTPRDSLVVMPTPLNTKPIVGARTGSDAAHGAATDAAPRLTLHATSDLPSSRTVKKPVIRTGDAPAADSSRVKMIVGAVVTAIAAGVVWFLTTGV